MAAETSVAQHGRTGVEGSRRIARLKQAIAPTAVVEPAPRIRAVGYVRVSSPADARNGCGLDAQAKAIRAFAASQGYDLVEVIADPGVSGAVEPAARPGFARVLELAADRSVSMLLVMRIDRLSRNLNHAVSTVAELQNTHKVAFRSVVEQVIDTTTSIGRTFFAVFAGIAEHDRIAMRDRMVEGRIIKAERGGLAAGPPPYGYRRGADGALEVEPTQAEVVRRIYREHGERRTLRAIAKGLMDDGIPAPSGSKWHPSGISYILDNAKYRGVSEYLFRASDGPDHVLRADSHEAIIGPAAEAPNQPRVVRPPQGKINGSSRTASLCGDAR